MGRPYFPARWARASHERLEGTPALFGDEPNSSGGADGRKHDVAAEATQAAASKASSINALPAGREARRSIQSQRGFPRCPGRKAGLAGRSVLRYATRAWKAKTGHHRQPQRRRFASAEKPTQSASRLASHDDAGVALAAHERSQVGALVASAEARRGARRRRPHQGLERGIDIGGLPSRSPVPARTHRAPGGARAEREAGKRVETVRASTPRARAALAAQARSPHCALP